MIKVLSLVVAVALIVSVYAQKRVLFGMGSNAQGQLAQNDITRPLQLFSKLGGSTIAQLCTSVSQQYTGSDVGMWRTVAITADGQIYGWGNIVGGAILGLSSLARASVLSTPTYIYTLPNPAQAITCGERHTIITTTAGQVYGFGENDNGQMATGDLNYVYNVTRLPNLESFTTIWAVGTVTLATNSSNNLYGVGANNLGQLGTLSGTQITTMSLVKVPSTVSAGGSAKVTKVTGSSEYTFYLTDAGDLYASGLDSNTYSRWGQNVSFTQSVYPLNNFTKIMSGIGYIDTQLSSSFAISSDQSIVYAWGDNTNGRLCLPLTIPAGGGTKYIVPMPAAIPSLSGQSFKITSVKLGTTHAILVADNGNMYGCGDNTYNQIGADFTLGNWSASPVGPLPTQITTSLVSGATYSLIPSATLLLSSASSIYGWGYASNLAFQQVFNSAFQINSTFNGTGIDSIVSGYQFSVVALSSGTYAGFGANLVTNILSNTSLDFYTPTTMSNMASTNITYLVVGGGVPTAASAALSTYAFMFGLANTSTTPNFNQLYATGINDLSQLAIQSNSTQYKYLAPTSIPLGANQTLTYSWVKVDLGLAHGLAILGDGAGTTYLYDWGSNAQGQIGLRTTVTRPTMILKEGGYILDCAAGDYHSVYIKKTVTKATGATTYTACATGQNTYGQLGLGQLQYTTSWLEIGAQVNGSANPFSNLTLINAWTGSDQTWILTNLGLYVMGSNAYGQLGLGSNVTAQTRQPIIHPFAAFQTTSVLQVACSRGGGSHTFVLMTNGDIYAMGRNDNGQLGLGDTMNRYTPTLVPRSTFANASAGVTDVVGVSVGVDHSLMMVGARDCPNNCNSRGVCNTVTGQCACYSEYLGTDCSLYQCPTPNCNLRGYCDTSVGVCVCVPSATYSGLSCEKRRCTSDCSGRGSCNTATGDCTCDKGWTGLGCESSSYASRATMSWLAVIAVAVLSLFHL